ncbi:MAG TPA: ribose-5-phosphate isomerase RpiA [Rhizomicrobium sp.]|jgi:ribose 5-phosphate isomerase A
MDSAALKRAAAERALSYVENGMKLGLGTGTTAEFFLELLAERIRDSGLRIVGAPTSQRTEEKARALGIPLGDLDDLAPLDLDIDGADEADRDLHLIKGGGGALLREKIVAASSRRMIVIVDGTKLVDRLGRFSLPVEVNPFGHVTTAARIARVAAALGYRDLAVTLRMQNGAVFDTDSGNLIYDCAFGSIADASALAMALGDIPGVAEHGLFIGLATTLIVARTDGIEVVERSSR